MGSVFQFGFDYEIAGFHIYFGEILLAIAALFIGALVCLRRKAASGLQTVMAVLLFGGVVACFVAAAVRSGGMAALSPAFSPEHSAAGGTFTIFALAPWAFVGFESISHSSSDAKFPLKRSFLIMAIAVFMPVMDGLNATQAIRSLERADAKTIPIIAMTANVFDEDVERSLKAGMNAHLSKPIEPEKLFEKLAELT